MRFLIFKIYNLIVQLLISQMYKGSDEKQYVSNRKKVKAAHPPTPFFLFNLQLVNFIIYRTFYGRLETVMLQRAVFKGKNIIFNIFYFVLHLFRI